MGTTNNRSLERAASFTGQKSGLPPKTLQPSDCEVVTNYLTKRGTLAKINGDTVYGLAGSGSSGITWIDIINHQLVLQRGTGLFIETLEGSGAFISAGTLSSSETVQSDQYRGEKYLVNGVDMKVYAVGSAPRNLGLQPPLSSNTSVASWTSADNAGGLKHGTVYNFTFTFLDDNNNVESIAANIRPDQYGVASGSYPATYWSMTTDSGDSSDDKDIHIAASTFTDLLTNTYSGTVLADTSRITHINIYMTGPDTEVNGKIFRYYGQVALTNGAYTGGAYQITAVATGVLLSDSNIPPPNALRQQEAYYHRYSTTPPATVGASVYKSIRFFRDSLFAIGTTGVQFTDTSQAKAFDSIVYVHEPFQPDYVFDTREVSSGDGQAGVAVAVLKDSVILVLKERSIYYLSGTGVDNYIVRVLDTRRGAVHRNTVQESPFGVFALDRSGVVLVSSTAPAELISQDIQDIIDSINFSAISSSYSGYDAKENRYYLSIPVEGSSIANKTIVYKADEQAWSVLQGQEGSSIFFGVNSTEGTKNIIGAESGGQLFDFSAETSVTIHGAQITSEYLSGPFFSGDPTVKKKAKFVYLTAESNADWTIDLGILPDFGQGSEFTLTDINSTSHYSVYAASLADSGVNVGVWDTSTWSGLKIRKQLKIPISCVGYEFQVRIINKSTDTNQYGFKILALELECVTMGK